MPNEWNLSPLLTGDNDPTIPDKLQRVQTAATSFITTWSNRTDYLTDVAVLKTALDELESWQRDFSTEGDVGYYFWLRSAQDENSPEIKAQINKITDFATKLQNDSQFFLLNLAKVPADIQEKFLTAPELAPYRHFLQRIFDEAKYLLSEPEERILNLKTPPAYLQWVDMVSGFLSREEVDVKGTDAQPSKKNISQLVELVKHTTKTVRDEAGVALDKIFSKHAQVGEAEINAILFNKKVDDELRGFTRPDASRHLADDVETPVVDALIKAVTAHYPVSQRYYALKAQLLNLPALGYHERGVPYGSAEKKYTFEQAVDLTGKVFTKLDPEFGQIFNQFVTRGHFDVYPRKHKQSGAFCAMHLKSQPTYILLNYTDTLRDVITLAHECGHGINNELIKKTQNALNCHTPTSTAEVASTFMEDFVLEELLAEADDELRLSILVQKMDDSISSIHRQIACYRFEQDLHATFREVGYISKEAIGNLFVSHMRSYLGAAVNMYEGSENWWLYWSHIRRFFYVYSYAGGLLISKSLQAKVKENPTFIQQVKQFLSAGTSDSPKKLFSAMGIDITNTEFWKNGLDEIERQLNETEALAVKLGKI